MNPSSDAQLAAIDRALMALCQERARLLRDLPGRTAAIDDLLQRSTGPLDATVLRDVFALLDQSASAEAPRDAEGAA